MPAAYLTTQGARVRRRGDALLVESDGEPLGTLHVHRLEGLCVFGRVHLTVPVLELLLGRGVPVAFFTVRGILKGRLVPPRTGAVRLRLAQYRRFASPQDRLRVSRSLVVAKLDGARAMVQRFASNHPGVLPGQSQAGLREHSQRARAARSLETLRGIEGAGTRAYFQALTHMNRSHLEFGGRSARPPGDPFNALLSLGYVLVTTELTHLLDAAGLDPYLGFYHEPADNRAALALDLVEPLRHPLVDRFCLAQANRRVFQRDDFERRSRKPGQQEGIYLRKDAFKRFLKRYDAWMRAEGPTGRPSPRVLLRQRVERFRRTLARDEPYEPLPVGL
jgi:CRISPR-associated protein Cas1